jgi:two-component system, cell cycle sensor histidine kinase and response regulator CckA
MSRVQTAASGLVDSDVDSDTDTVQLVPDSSRSSDDAHSTRGSLSLGGRELPFVALTSDFATVFGREDTELMERFLVHDTVVDGLVDVVFRIDDLGRWDYLTPTWTDLTGLDVADCIGRPVVDFVHGGERQLCRQTIDALLSGSVKRGHEQFRIVTLHAGARWVVFRARPELGPDGTITGARGTMYDFTERKAERVRHEEQLRQSQRMEAVGRLAGGISHDFNNLLTVILSYSDLIAQAVQGQPRVTSDATELQRAGERAVGLTRQLLAFSRQQILKPADLDVNAVVSAMATMLRSIIGEDVVLKLIPADVPAVVRADVGQLEQVIVNLAVNARDAMPGGGTLTLAVWPATLDDDVARRWGVPVENGPYIVIEVSDTGQGMDAETQRRIFEPFFSTKDKGRGTGLGLATVYGIVKQSGGYIWVHSQVGSGATFEIWLPRIAGSAEPVAPSRRMRPFVRGCERVLVVEDEHAVRTLARRVLEEAGYTVLDAANADQALTVLRTLGEPIDLLCTDVVMPGVNGRELAQEVEIMCPAVKVLYMSGYDDGVLAVRMRGSGGTLPPDIALLEKPFTPETLTRRVRDVLDGPSR